MVQLARLESIVDWEWRSLPALGGEPLPTCIRLGELLEALCERGLSVGVAWGAVFDLVETGHAEPLVKAPRMPGIFRKDIGEGDVFLKTSPVQIEAYRRANAINLPAGSVEGAAEKHSPKWDLSNRIITYNINVCYKYRRHAPEQFVILNAFEQEEWPETISNPFAIKIKAKATTDDLNKRIKHIKFTYNQSAERIRWSTR